jgi:uncharacterized membrane protein YtjA (UPF0391 family)
VLSYSGPRAAPMGRALTRPYSGAIDQPGGVGAYRGPASREDNEMLKWALIFAVIAVVAGFFGFTGIAAGAAGFAKILFMVFLVLFIVVVVLALLGIGAVI